MAYIQNFLQGWTTPVSAFGYTVGGMILAVLIIWSIYWKGMALWKAAKNNSQPWFIVLLVVNTVGILEILYIYVFSKRRS